MYITEALIQAKIAVSMAEARRLVAQKAVRIFVPEKQEVIESVYESVNVGDKILVGKHKSFTVQESEDVPQDEPGT